MRRIPPDPHPLSLGAYRGQVFGISDRSYLVVCHPERSEGSKMPGCYLLPVPVESLLAGVWILHSVQNDILTA